MPNTPDEFQFDAARADELILVDAFDRPVGTATKEVAHLQALLHRAFSVVLVREGAEGPELLISQRAQGKYHSEGLWANSCCSHPRVGEETIIAAARRTQEELGVEALELREIDSFMYCAPFTNGVTEFEYDHVFLARCKGELALDPSEVSATRWVSAEELSAELVAHPEHFAVWAHTVLPMALKALAL